MKKRKLILWFTCFIICTSCIVDEQCRQNRYVAMKIDFFHVVSNKAKDTIITTVLSIDSITVKGLKYDTLNSKYIFMDSILYNNLKPATSISLPLHNIPTVSMYQATFNTINDTIKVFHKNTDYYLSLECGCLKIHNIDTVMTTNHFIDSVKIINRTVNNTNAENIRLYK